MSDSEARGEPEGADEISQEQVFELFRKVDAAFRGDDIEALRTALGSPAGFPNSPLPPLLDIGERILHHAIFFSSPGFIRQLIEAGADLKYESAERIPPLFSALLSERDDRAEILALLLDHGANHEQQGYNDWVPLHLAVNARDVAAIKLLVSRGADPYWRASDDDADTSPFDDALAMEFDEGVEAMLNGAN